MGVYICLGQEIYETSIKKALNYRDIGSFKKIQELLETHPKQFIFMGKGVHKIKKKAEQIACEEALKQLE